MANFELRRPASVAEALEDLAVGGVPYCGGTELVPIMQMGLMAPEILVDLKRVRSLGGIREDGDEIVLGARVTHDEAEGSPLVRRHASVLAEATSRLGNARVRATGTLAGNICFAEPRSDVLTALLALEARVDLRSATGSRMVDVADFVEGAFTTVREEEELLAAIRIPAQISRSAYVRFQPGEYPTVAVAVVQGSASCRVVVGAVGEIPGVFTFPRVEDVDAAQIAAEVDVTEDLGGREDYKRHVTGVFVRRAVARLAEGSLA
ncbi:FAD binding domain-containing protein [Modestobacter sp. VKM Ac-2979]|uniref:FAD binding domain-containing protein n=1 Tax=unclassified Modestobacter TaxID=2643866 RepID=UPI0022AB6A53|nr:MULTISPECIES: FAD binding domain-containing protein [unclassified Modestobacter]MCZ2813930.1 FAD binding domain-containing protein [Modestobacter sp. VKM Ac-2979]MCZ2844655.1 FAD binding domain-containing protein [Modestobacter sp. VKM Ac-2980]